MNQIFNSSKFIDMKPYLFLLSYLIIGFIPYFDTIDIIGSQWFYLSIINIIYFIFHIRNKFFIETLLSIIKSPPLKFYLLFIFFAFLSLFYTYNLRISVVDFSRIIIVLFSIINISFYFINNKFSLYNFYFLIVFVLFLEVIYSFYPLFVYFLKYSLSELDWVQLPFGLKGIAGNKNVLASNIVFKLPFVFYLIYKSKGAYLYIFSFILYLSLLLIYLLTARASYISCVIITFLFYLIVFTRVSLKKFLQFYILPYFLLAISIIFVSSISSTATPSKLNTLNIIDESSNNRIILYDNAIDFIINHPFIGCGLGNWKIESLPYWKSLLTGYIVPYHAHNDFLELATETGILGGLSYLAIFLFIFYWSLRQFYLKKEVFSVLIFCITSVYFIDAMLNFPLERALSQVNFILIIVLLFLKINSNEKSFN